MGIENMGNGIEKKEIIPSLEEIRNTIREAVGSREFKEARMVEDEQGVCLLEVNIQTKNGLVEYGYMRKGRRSSGEISSTAIHAVFYDTDGMPSGGCKFAELINGVWKFNQDFKEL